jgi:rSAM-associated Gly-rich repeat protein
MSTQNRIAKALSMVLPAGAVGASLLLAVASAPASAELTPAPVSSNPPGIAARLKAIRSGVSEMTTQPAATESGSDPTAAGELVPTWWGNGGWGNGHIGWGNGGWHLGWGNGGWNNGWHNGGWANGWGNGGWPNGWHNFWHNG